MAHNWTSDFGGGLETIKLFHHLWYGDDCVPILTVNWGRVLSLLHKSLKEAKAGEKGFDVDPDILRADGKIMIIELEHEPGDVRIIGLVDRMFGYR